MKKKTDSRDKPFFGILGAEKFLLQREEIIDIRENKDISPEQGKI